MSGYKTGRVKLVATQDELGEIKIDDEGFFITYGIDDINEQGLKKWKKRGLIKDDQVSFKINKEGFACDIIPSTIPALRKPGGKNI